MRTGIFGGAFDPFHQEHKNVIIAAKEELELDKIIVLPSYLPPHKSNIVTPYEDREAMVIAGCRDLPYVIVDDLERRRGGVNPTSEILPILKQANPDDEMYLIIGGDSARDFHSWINPKKIADIAKIAIVSRSGADDIDAYAAQIREDYGADVTVLQYKGGEISSSALRASLFAGVVPEGLPEGVSSVIEERKLYRQYTDLVERLRHDLSKKRFMHSVGTAVYAVGFCSRLHLPYEDVFVAAILHDCGKERAEEVLGIPSGVVHQFVGEERARRYYGIKNEDVLDAIKYHTTGKANMTTLGKLIFCADVLEPGRDYPGVDELRELFEKDFEKGFLEIVKHTYRRLVQDKMDIYYLTVECLEYYNTSEECRKRGAFAGK